MKCFLKILGHGSVAVAALLLSANASAAVTCIEGNTQDNRLKLTNISGDTPACEFADDGNENNFDFFDDLDLLWKINIGEDTEGSGPDPFKSLKFNAGTNNTEGSLELVSGLTDHFLVFKFGQGKTDPNLFVFDINGMVSANWALLPSGEGNGLSHVSVYGSPVDVPEPTSLALMGLGLVAVGYRMRRRRTV